MRFGGFEIHYAESSGALAGLHLATDPKRVSATPTYLYE